MWRQRRWSQLLNLIDHIPGNSYFIEALVNDPEWAEAQKLEEIERTERLSEWSPEVVMLAQILDRLGSILAVGIQSAGGTAPRIQPHPRPVTAIKDVRIRRRRQEHADLVSRLVPQRGD